MRQPGGIRQALEIWTVGNCVNKGSFKLEGNVLVMSVLVWKISPSFFCEMFSFFSALECFRFLCSPFFQSSVGITKKKKSRNDILPHLVFKSETLEFLFFWTLRPFRLLLAMTGGYKCLVAIYVGTDGFNEYSSCVRDAGLVVSFGFHLSGNNFVLL